jgi:chromosome segregation ATPase
MSRPKYLWSLTLVVLSAAAFWAGRLSTSGTGEAERAAQLEQENHDLRAAIDKLRQNQAQSSESAETRADHTRQAQPPKPDQKPFNENQVIVSLQENLALQQKAAAEKDARLADLTREIETFREEAKRLAESQSELQAQVASIRQQADEAQSAVQKRDEQLSQVQTENKRSRDQFLEASQKLARTQKAIAELQDIYRRRDNYLTSLLSRYRDVNRQYRALANVLENRAPSETTPGGSGGPVGPEIARIQDAIQLAEEDIRQLNNLGAQAQRLQKQLDGK